MSIKKLEDELKNAGFDIVRLDRASTREAPMWECRIGLHRGKFATLPGGSDLPMRVAVETAFEKITGQEADFNYSGWGAELNAIQEHTEYGTEVSPEIIARWFAKKIEEYGPEVVEALVSRLSK